jgi:hypothetical protein
VGGARSPAKDKSKVRYFQLFEDRSAEILGQGAYQHVEIDGSRRPTTPEERADPSKLPPRARVFTYDSATSQGHSPTKTVDFEFDGGSSTPAPTATGSSGPKACAVWQRPDAWRSSATPSAIFATPTRVCRSPHASARR